jgi:hypothetical protein
VVSPVLVEDVDILTCGSITSSVPVCLSGLIIVFSEIIDTLLSHSDWIDVSVEGVTSLSFASLLELKQKLLRTLCLNTLTTFQGSDFSGFGLGSPIGNLVEEPVEILDLPVHFPNHPAFGPISPVGVPIQASPLTIEDCEVSTAKVDSVSAESYEFLMESDQFGRAKLGSGVVLVDSLFVPMDFINVVLCSFS